MPKYELQRRRSRRARTLQRALPVHALLKTPQLLRMQSLLTPTPPPHHPHIRPVAAAGLGACHARLHRLRAANAGALGAADDLPQEQQQQQPERPEAPYDLKPFPRRRERDPYRLLGVEREASFEEVQDARNYLFEVRSLGLFRCGLVVGC